MLYAKVMRRYTLRIPRHKDRIMWVEGCILIVFFVVNFVFR